MKDQKKKKENVFEGKILANTLYVLSVLLILAFFIQSITGIFFNIFGG